MVLKVSSDFTVNKDQMNGIHDSYSEMENGPIQDENNFTINMDQMNGTNDSKREIENNSVQKDFNSYLTVIGSRKYLPTKQDNLGSLDPNIAKLVYLTRFSDKYTFIGSPFSEKASIAFYKAEKWKKIASYTLWTGLIISTFLAAAPFVVAIPKVSDWTEQSRSNNTKLIMGIVLVGVFANIINFIATGIFPNEYTTTVEDKGIYIDKMKNNYKKMAQTLNNLNNEKHDLAVLIAQKINADTIKNAMKEKQFTNAFECLNPLKKTISSILER